MGDRLDGHMIQGHVDQVGKCADIVEKDGSWIITIKYSKSNNITVEKGSIAINGISLTVFGSNNNSFSVAIIPYTYSNTNFKTLKVGDTVNLEFDILGKYLEKMLSKHNWLYILIIQNKGFIGFVFWKILNWIVEFPVELFVKTSPIFWFDTTLSPFFIYTLERFL